MTSFSQLRNRLDRPGSVSHRRATNTLCAAASALREYTHKFMTYRHTLTSRRCSRVVHRRQRAVADVLIAQAALALPARQDHCP